MSPVKEARQILEKAGWTFTRTGAHHVYRCPCGQHTHGVCSSPNSARLLTTYATKAIRRCARDNRPQESAA